jgi:hypothetical protein
VRLLGALGLRLVDPALGHRVPLAVPIADDVARLAHGDAGHRHRVRSHIGDQPDVPVWRLGPLVQALRDRHRPLRAEGELAACFLLQRRRRERRRGAALLRPGGDRRDARTEPAQGLGVLLGSGAIADLDRLALDPDELGLECLARLGLQERAKRPVLPRDERIDLALPLDHEAHGHGLHATRRQPAPNLARDQRAERVAHEPIDDPARLLGVDEVGVDAPRVREGLANGTLGDLGERDSPRLRRGNVRRLGHVPRDRFALAVEVGGEVDGVGALCRLGDVGDLLATVLRDHVLGREAVLDVHAELALAGIVGQVTDVPVRRQDTVIVAEVALDRPCLGWRLDDHEVLRHRGGVYARTPYAPINARSTGHGGAGVALRPRARDGGSPRRSRGPRPRPAGR